MTKIVVFTNCPSLNSVNKTFRQRIDVKLLSATNEILWFNENESLFEVPEEKRFANDGLYLVSDEILAKKFLELTEDVEVSEIFILKHREPDESSFKLDKISPNILQGEHTANGSYYPDLVRIISDSAGDKIDRIIEEVFKYDPVRETNLNLLTSLFPEKNPHHLDDLLEKHLQFVPDDVKSKTYNEKLIPFRALNC